MDVGFIGTGSMGGMLVRSLVRHGALAPEQVWAANRTPGKLEALRAAVPGIHTAPTATVSTCPVVFLCVKPGDTRAALAEMEPALRADQLLILLSNLVPIAGVEEQVPCRVAKVIPSLAQEAGCGIALVMYGRRVTPRDRQWLEGLLGAISRPLVIEESQGRTCADLTSCGPAFLACVLREMALAASRQQPDLPPEMAAAMVRETVLATARLLEAGMDFEAIIRRVAVPGGVTAAGLAVLEEQIPGTWEQLLTATRHREENAPAPV
ncbi:MAG: pyrroline-5-carboxylate reductase dimerization domain-containing protein [Bacillota bacterium]